MELKSVLMGAGIPVAVVAGLVTASLVASADDDVTPAPTTTTATEPAAEVTPEPVPTEETPVTETSDPTTSEPVPAHEPEVTETTIAPEAAPETPSAPAPPADATTVEPAPAPPTWVGDDGTIYKKDPNNSENPSAPPMIVEPTQMPTDLPQG